MSFPKDNIDKVNKKILDFIDTLKTNINVKGGEEFLELIERTEPPLLTPKDFEKKKRVKNNIPMCDRCEAKKASGERCTRRKKKIIDITGNYIDTNFCGTHNKSTPHGKINDIQTSVNKIEIKNIEYKGILYFIDNNYNVYDHDDILQNKENPKVICKYSLTQNNGENVYTINV